jgi:hypothetical protein
MEAPRDLRAAHPVGTPQDDMRAADLLHRFSRARHPLLQLAALLRREDHHHPLSHATIDARESH